MLVQRLMKLQLKRRSDASRRPRIQLVELHRLHRSTRFPTPQFVRTGQVPRQVVGVVEFVRM